MRGNKGYSLIELVVVIALLAILGTVIVGSIASINNSEASKCANNINSLATKCKVNSMSRAKDVAVVIYFDGKNYVGEYHEGDTLVSTDVLGSRRVSLAYSTDAGGSTSVSLSDGAKLYIAFDRATGALKSIEEAADIVGNSAEDAYLTSVIVSANGRETNIDFVQPTGKHFIR